MPMNNTMNDSVINNNTFKDNNFSLSVNNQADNDKDDEPVALNSI